MPNLSLIERLRATKTQVRTRAMFGGAVVLTDESETREVPVNPDGPEAATALEQALEALKPVDEAEATCPFNKPRTPPRGKPCPDCGATAGNSCHKITIAHSLALTKLRTVRQSLLTNHEDLK